MTSTPLSEAINNTLFAYNSGQQRYLNEFIKLNKSAADMLHLGLFPNAKEITESYSAFNAVKTKLKQYELGDPGVTVVSVGDGRTPRTAALFAFRTKWQCVSVDPLLSKEKIPYWESNIQRLKCYPNKVEDLDLMYNKLIIVMVHSHANLRNTLDHIRSPVRSVVGIPCCVAYKHEIRPKEFRDAGILSTKNLVKVWRTI